MVSSVCVLQKPQVTMELYIEETTKEAIQKSHSTQISRPFHYIFIVGNNTYWVIWCCSIECIFQNKVLDLRSIVVKIVAFFKLCHGDLSAISVDGSSSALKTSPLLVILMEPLHMEYVCVGLPLCSVHHWPFIFSDKGFWHQY